MFEMGLIAFISCDCGRNCREHFMVDLKRLPPDGDEEDPAIDVGKTIRKALASEEGKGWRMTEDARFYSPECDAREREATG